MCVCVCVYVLSAGDVLEGGVTRHAKNVLLKRRKPVSEQADAMQCESCGRWFRSGGGLALEDEQQQLPRDRWWCADSVGELLADRETSRDTSAFQREADQWKIREALSSAYCATDGLGVLAASVCTREEKTESHSFHRKDT